MASEKQGCSYRLHEVTEKDLPLSCPMPGQRIWDAHPQVYLPIEQEQRVTCPYCDAEYVLKQDA
jgi:uncharacterized Zn-finger protein